MAKNSDAALERNSRKLLARLKKGGWKVLRINGSHHILKNARFKHPIVLVHPKKDLPIGLVRQIYRDAGWPV